MRRRNMKTQAPTKHCKAIYECTKAAWGMPVPMESHWRMLVLYTHLPLKILNIFSAKDNMVESTCENLAMLIGQGVPVMYLHMSNAVDNKCFAEKLKNEARQLDIKVEFIVHDTTQQNSIAEVAIATIVNCTRAMMHHANLLIEIC